jgi:esterase/lipase superfamily enzyme
MNPAQLALCLIVVGSLAGCAGSSRALMPTPNLYTAQGAADPFDAYSQDSPSPDVDILYVTDRVPDNEEDEPLSYGFGRSPSVAFGSAIVQMGEGLSWNQLASSSVVADRQAEVKMHMGSITEIGRTPQIPYPVVLDGDILKPDPAAITLAKSSAAVFQQELSRRLELSPRKEVVMFVHGYNNKFEDAAFTLAETWHFLGRLQVPVIYTWPAGHGGVKGYSYDRESGEFTVHHLKNFLRQLADNKDLERIHLIAHSRGTDVENLVLAAPDLDFEVFMQRILAERVGQGVDQLTFYTSQHDKVLGLAERFLGSATRMGRVQLENFTPKQIESMQKYTNVVFVELAGASEKGGHGYFHSSPEASSDLILLIRYGKKPGSENGRPLVPEGVNFWMIKEGYPESGN